MFGLEDLPHAAPPQLVQHHVVAQDQPARLASINRLGLEPRQAALAMQQLGQIVSRLRLLAGGQVVQDRLQLIFAQQSGGQQIFDELIERRLTFRFLMMFPQDRLQLTPQLAPPRLPCVPQKGFEIGFVAGFQFRLELPADLVDFQQGGNGQRIVGSPRRVWHRKSHRHLSESAIKTLRQSPATQTRRRQPSLVRA